MARHVKETEAVDKAKDHSIYRRIRESEFFFNLFVDHLLITLYIQFKLFHHFDTPLCDHYVVRVNVLYHKRSFL